jgi:hypothetical protein
MSKLEGKIKVIGETKTFGEKGFRKRDLVITTEEQYPQSILVEFVQDKCDLLDKFKVGSDVAVGINIRGREWVNPQGETKYFNSIQGWRIDAIDSNVEPEPDSIPVKYEIQEKGTDEDLPF